MSFVATKSKFHVALDGQGLILSGAPDRLAYQMTQAPIYGSRFAQGDRDYADFSFWWFWAQTDFSGGLKEDPGWEDDGKFKSSKNLDALSVGGQIKIFGKPVVQTTDISTNSGRISRIIHGTVDDGTNVITRFFLGNMATTTDGSNGARLWQSEDGDTWVLINHFLNVSGINDLFISLQTLFILLTTELYVFNDATTAFTTVTERTTEFNTSGLVATLFTSGCDVGGVAHVIGATAAQSSLKTSIDDGATFTVRILFPIGVFVYNCADFNGEFYYLRFYGTTTALHRYNVGTTTDVLVYEFKGLTPIRNNNTRGNNTALIVVGNTLHIQFTDGSIWSCTTEDVVTRENENRDSIVSATESSLITHREVGFGRDIIIRRNAGVTTIANNRFGITDSDSNYFVAFASNGTTILFVNNSGSNNNVYRLGLTPTAYFATGYLTTNEYAEIPSIDKLHYDVTLNFVTLVSGESIGVEYSIDGGTTFTSIGTASYSVDGAITNKNFLFGDAIVSKTLVLRITLNGDGTTTPTVKDFAVRFYPMVTAKKLWNINANCADDVKRLDGALIDTVGRELKGRLERAWWTKSILDFQDLDYATTLLNGALTSSTTTITVDDTADFPEQGRLRVDNEDMTYTGKTPTTFTGVTRAVRETKAAAHSDNAVINNAYKVILTDLQYKVPVSLEDKELEYVVGISLREV